MTTLTLDQARTIIYSAATADEALEALRLIGVEASSYEHEAYSVDCGDLTFVSFTYSPHTKKLYVLEAGEFVTPEQRKAFLESQQQPTDTVPAVSTVAEARPESFVTSSHSPSESEWEDISTNLFGFFTVLGYLPNRDETFQRVFYGYVCSALGPQKNVFDASLRTLLDALTLTHDRLSTRPLEASCFCPACDYDLAKATKDHDADFYHVTCSICSLDRDFDSVELSTESVDKEAY